MNTINEIMDKPPSDLKPQDIDILIALHRNARAKLDIGEKPKKDRPKVEVDMSKIVSAIKPPAPEKSKFIRRV
jgi:hypothetical protein